MSLKKIIISLKEKLIKSITKKVESEGEDHLKPNPLTPMEERRRRLIKSIYNMLTLESIKQKIRLFNSIVRAQLPRELSSEEYRSVEEEFDKSRDHMAQFYEKYRDGKEVGSRAISLADILGISNKTLLSIYNLACKLQRQQRNNEAMVLFEMLMILKPRVTAFWISVGVTLDTERRFFEAIKIYKYGKSTFPKKASFPLHLAKSYLSIREMTMAKVELEEAERLLEFRSEKERGWREAIDTIREHIAA